MVLVDCNKLLKNETDVIVEVELESFFEVSLI